MTIFRAYDARGVYPEEINADIAFRIGVAFGRFIGKGTVSVGCDARLSSPELKEAVIRGLSGRGLDVMDIGMIPTQMLYFSVAYLKLDGGIMITASHNPKEYNGFKFCTKNGVSLSYETGIDRIEKWVNEDSGPLKVKGSVQKKDLKKEYMSHVLKHAKIKNGLKIVIDAGNGVGGLVAPDLFRKLGCDVIELFCEPDGRFPNHHPDPLVKENLKALQKAVVSAKADLGIAFDGDADRVSFVNERGDIIENNSVFAILIKDALRDNPGGRILYEILASKMISDVIKSEGGVEVVSRVGHSYIQNTMIEKRCILGGETSAHYFFRESYSYDDGIFAAAKLVSFLSQAGRQISSFVNELPKYFTSDDTRISCDDEKKFKVVEHLKKKFRKNGFEMMTIDGVKVFFRSKNSWFVARASNTQPAIVIRWEAMDKKEFKRVGSFIKGKIENAIKTIS
jgi:phosphomannomutase/phosphoglucomutase